ncbi:MAG: hypothetical protein QOH15_2149 [Gaiellales bacterium]|jgi:hypothetical protein|nr:hypothetical protein [Gaiellales bacterium]
MRRIRVFTVALVVALAALVASGSASAAGWEQISRDGLDNIDEATTALSGSSVVVAWTYHSSVGADSIEATTFSSSLTDSVQNPVTVPAVSDWASLNSDPELLTAPDGSLVLVFDGTHTTTTTDPLSGIAVVDRSSTGAFAPPVVVVPGQSANYGLAGLYEADGSTLISGDCCGGAAFIFHGAVKVGDAADGHVVTNRQIARDHAGNVWIAWYDLDRGIVMRQIDGTTGVPLGAVAVAPDSNVIYNNGSRVALACNPVGAGCRVVYLSGDGKRLLSWAPGEPAPTTIVTVGRDEGIGVFNAAYKADGRLWVGWIKRPALTDSIAQFTLGDVRGAGQPSYPVSLQKLGTPYHLRLQPIGEALLMVGNFTTPGGGSSSSQWANLVGIPGAVVDNSGPKDVPLQSGTKKGTFRIAVIFKAPSQCGSSCKARSEIRSRTGVCAAACLASGAKKLPGDGPVVIGTRGTFTVPGTKKIHFYLDVTKAALLKTPFHTEGGFRVGDTRLRVYITTAAGTVLAVRDGHIKVSIARIKSGALPGLTGIL